MARRTKVSDWYQRYAAYPPYCATPTEMERRKIPPVKDESGRAGSSELVHVTAILRHGSRTPWKRGLNCWAGYMSNPETAVWNCSISTLASPPPPESQGGASSEEIFLFDKKYDALMDPANDLSNWLNGTCQLGQLLLRGYEQEISNGQHLREAYFYDDDDGAGHDSRMRLLDIGSLPVGTNPWDKIYYRVDDEQRTVMSGQIVLRGLMGKELAAFYSLKKQYPIIPLHTADYDVDVLVPNEDICPRLEEMRSRFERSSSYQSFYNSGEGSTLRSFQREVLGIEQGEMDAIDCLMTTICTDRPLPSSVDDYNGSTNSTNGTRRDIGNDQRSGADSQDYGTNLFQRLVDYYSTLYTLHYLPNDAEYAKLGMGPLWAEIMDNIYPFVYRNETDICCPVHSPPVLAIFSGHDTTIMPLLASLGRNVWDGQWAPYASLICVEIHKVNLDGKADPNVFKSEYAFRLIYNGKVLTPSMSGCPPDSELCDVKVLFDRVQPFAIRNPNCTVSRVAPTEYTDSVIRAQDVLSTNGGIVLLFALVVGGFLSGAVFTFLYTLVAPDRRRAVSSAVDGFETELAAGVNGTGRAYSDEGGITESNVGCYGEAG